jgi:ligand-binding sensor domain-containing protein
MWINALAVGDQGQVWVGAYAGPDDQGGFAGDLHVYSEEGWRRVGLPIDAGVGALAVDADGRLWVGLVPAGFLGQARFELPTQSIESAVLGYRPGEWRRVGPEQGLGLPAVFALQVDAEGQVWAGGALGVAAIKPRPIWEDCG